MYAAHNTLTTQEVLLADDSKPQHWWQTVPGCLTAVAAIITAMTGLIIALNQISNRDAAKPNPPLQSPPAASPVAPVAKEAASSTPAVPTALSAAPALPSNTCPAVQGMFWMQYPNSWYGPFAEGDAVQFSSAGGFYVYHGAYNTVVPYPDPQSQIPRNVWFPLQQSRFSVCVDSVGHVFAWSQ